jgi:cellulose synthase/poly-beta-1,6-N-acetylglucosamine synthase-like glycosyltransferase
VVPAHNEEKLVATCVASLRASEYAAAIYVVAHNCSDATAERAAGAEVLVLVLNETSGHGKGAALDFGFAHALAAGAEGVLVVDSDSTVAPNLTALTAAALQRGAAATQCRYVVANAAGSDRARLMALALLGMNVLRPRGRSRLGLSCGIFGNGFALAAETLRKVPYVAHSIVEDLEYHLLLVRAGMRVEFLDEAQVFGEMPATNSGAATQRARWEGGRMLMRRQSSLPLLREVLWGRLQFVEPLLDLLALPLANTAMLLLVALVLPVWWVRVLAVFGLGVLALYVVVAAWLGDDLAQDLKALVFAPFYVAFKVAQIPRTRRAARKNAAWVRTERNDTESPQDPGAKAP